MTEQRGIADVSPLDGLFDSMSPPSSRRKSRGGRGVKSRGGAEPISSTRRGDRVDEPVLDVGRSVVEAPLNRINNRGYETTRELDPGHVVELAHSIQFFGLVEPIVVDLSFDLVAGGHRRAACIVLSTAANLRGKRLLELVNADKLKPDTMKRLAALDEGEGSFDSQRVPFRVLPFKSKEDPQRAIEAELTENNQRRDYTPAEARRLYEQLREAGYRTKRGRAAKGQKRAMPVMVALIGKSERHVRELLNGKQKTTANRDEAFDRRKMRAVVARYLERHGSKAPKQLREKAQALVDELG